MIQSRLTKTLLGVSALLSVTAYFLLRQALEPPAGYAPTAAPSFEEVAQAEAVITEAVKTFSARPGRTGGGREEFTQSLSEKTLNDYLASHPEALPAGVPVENLQLDLLPGSVRATGTVQFHDRKVCLQVTGVLSFPDGRTPKLDPSEVRLGRVPAVGPLRDRLCRELAGKLPLARLPDHVYVRSLEITDDSVLIYGDRYAR